MPSMECRVVGLIEIDDPVSRIWPTPSPPTDRLTSRHVRFDSVRTLGPPAVRYADLSQLQEQLQTLFTQVRARMAGG